MARLPLACPQQRVDQTRLDVVLSTQKEGSEYTSCNVQLSNRLFYIRRQNAVAIESLAVVIEIKNLSIERETRPFFHDPWA